MEINEKLFADVLSGKLKGTFVLKNGFTVKSNRLFDSNSTNCYRYCFKGFSTSFTVLGKSSSAGYDIIDFIPDTDMKENELAIEIPEGKEIDWDESKKQNKIVLKDKQLTYKDICEKLFSKLDTYYYVNNHGNISAASSICNPYIINPNSASTAHQLECILAKNKLANVSTYLNKGKNIYRDPNFVYIITLDNGTLQINKVLIGFYCLCSSIWFYTKKDAQQAIEILGEETVKLALEPLGI